MSNYTQNVSYAPKDALLTGDPNKAILGSQIDAELSEISTAIASKEDAANKDQANGYAGLNGSSLLPDARLTANIPRLDIANTFLVSGSNVLLTKAGGIEVPQTLDLGHATDTTLSRVAAGRIAVEGAELARLSAAQAFTAAQQFTTLEIGHATDTTLSRLSAGRVGIEGVELASVGATETISASWNFTAAQQFATLEIGHASDTTLARSSAGNLTVEGVLLVKQGDTIEVGHANDTTLSRIAAGRLAVEGIELGYRGLPSASVTTGAFAAADAGKCVYATAGVTIPNSVMAANDAIVIQNTTGAGITITKSITTAYNTGTGSALGATFTLNSRGRCSIIFTSATECYVSGNIA